MGILVNEQEYPFAPGLTLSVVARSQNRQADLFIVNGYPVDPDTELHDGDCCWLLSKGTPPLADEIEDYLYARHTPGVQKFLAGSSVGIMGLGGLGSAVAVALARMGIGRLLLADFDVVDPTNLNRQQYFLDQIGMAKTEALSLNLARINPGVEVQTIRERLDEENIVEYFRDVSALAECFDDPALKAAGLRAALIGLRKVPYVGASGMAGYGENNAIQTKRLYPGVYVVGDEVSEARPGQGLMAARVGIAAHHQANQIVRLLLGADEGRE